MVIWDDFIKSIVHKPSCLDDLTFSLNDENEEFSVPLIIKSSIVLGEMLTSIDKNNKLFIFPERDLASCFYALSKVVYDIAEGRTARIYDPYTFHKGQKLKYKDCIFEFDSISEYKIDDKTRYGIKIRFSNLDYIFPLDIAPFFQLSDSRKQLSTYESFTKIFKVREALYNENNDDVNEDVVQVLTNYKTHFEGSTCLITSVKRIRDLINKSTMNGYNINQVLLIGQIDMKGNLNILGSGQYAGDPALLLASNLYYVQNAISKGTHINKIIIDISNINVLETQLDAFDELLTKEIPIICITDTINSFDLGTFEDRNFNIWRWNKDSITKELYRMDNIYDTKIDNCINQNIEYLNCEDKGISEVFTILYENRKIVTDETAFIMDINDRLHSFAFNYLRNAIPFNFEELNKFNSQIELCLSNIHNKKRFIPKQLYNDFIRVIEILKRLYDEECIISKVSELQNKLIKYNYNDICIIIPKLADSKKYSSYWEFFVKSKNLKTRVHIYYADEFCKTLINTDLTVVLGWYSETTMRKILHNYNTKIYLILLYNCESSWKSSHIIHWSKSLNLGGNNSILTKLFDNNEVLKFNILLSNNEIEVVQDDVDELREIEEVLRDNKYRQLTDNGAKIGVEKLEAIPMSFVGDNIGFYKPTHKMITVTDIIVNDSDSIKTKCARDVLIGDFIVIRESQRDVIKDIADKILENSGKSSMSLLARKWKESLLIESLFLDDNQIFEKLVDLGCTRGKVTVEQWIRDNDIIAPQSKEDIKYIAQVTEDMVLLEKLDQVYEAAQDVKRAHIQAGQILSQRLKQQIVSYLNCMDSIDLDNIWDPILFEVEDIGVVTIYKIINKSSTIMVDSNNTNKLFKNERYLYG